MLVKLVQLVSGTPKCREASDGVGRLQIQATYLSVTHSLQRLTCNIVDPMDMDKRHQKKELVCTAETEAEECQTMSDLH